MDLGRTIQQLRNTNDILQAELSMQMSVPVQEISKWESGEVVPDLDQIVKLSQIFGVSTDYMLKSAAGIDPEPPAAANNTKSEPEKKSEPEIEVNADDQKEAEKEAEEEAFMLVYTEEMLDHYNNKVRVVVGGILSFFGVGGVLTFLILSFINPVIYSVGTDGNPMNETMYTGIRAFLMGYNIVWLFALCFVIGVIGLVTLAFADLKGFTWHYYADAENSGNITREDAIDMGLDPEAVKEMEDFFNEE